jgi:hypothetical protein
MNLSKTTFVTLNPHSHVSCNLNEESSTASLFLSGTESIIIQFVPENLPVLMNLVAALQQLNVKSRQIKLENLQDQIEQLRYNHESERSSAVLTLLDESDSSF